MVPFRAIKRKHWKLASLSFTYVLVSLVFPASQGGLTTIAEVVVTGSTEPFDLWTYESKNASNQYTGDYVNHAAAISAPNGAVLPPWTTTQYAVAPFSPIGNNISRNETWTAATEFYYAEPQCHRFDVQDLSLRIATVETPDVSPVYEGSVADTLMLLANITIASPVVCNLSFELEFTVPRNITGSFFWLPISSPNGLSDNETPVQPNSVLGNCSLEWYYGGLIQLNQLSWQHPNHTVSVGENTDWIQTQLTFFACYVDYFSTLGQATVDGDTRSITTYSIPPDTEHRVLLSTKGFNATAFEYSLVGGGYQGVVVSTEDVPVYDASNPSVWATRNFDSLAKIAYNNATTTFMLNGTPMGAQPLLVGNSFGEKIEDIYRLVFALALSSFVNSTSNHTTTEGFRTDNTYSITIVSAFALLSETLLALAAVLLFSATLLYHRRWNVLRSDPDSIAAQCAVLTDSFSGFGTLKCSDSNFECASTAELEELASSSSLKYDEKSELLVPNTMHNACSAGGHTTLNSYHVTMNKDSLPFFVTRVGFLFAIVSLLCIGSAGIFLCVWSLKNNGFAFLAQSTSFQSQLFWSFAPTLIATFIEPCWGSIHRDLSLLESWVRLFGGTTTAKASLSLRYSSRPPPVVLILSLIRRHFMIAFVSTISITTSILNISMSGLFSQLFITVQVPVSLSSSYAATTPPSSWDATALDVKRAFDIVYTNMSDSTKMLPWTNTKNSFIPLTPSSSETRYIDFETSSTLFKGTTLGIGASLSCENFPMTPNTTADGPGITDSCSSMLWPATVPSTNQSTSCQLPVALVLRSVPSITYNGGYSLLNSIVDCTDSLPKETSIRTEACSERYIVISQFVPEVKDRTELYLCTPDLRTASFNITYTGNGDLISSQILPETADGSQDFIIDTTTLMSFFLPIFGEAADDTTADMDTFFYDFPGILTTRLRNITGNTDIPSLANDVFARVFASWFSLYRDLLLTPYTSNATNLVSSQGTITYREARMIPSIPAFTVTFGLLFLYLIAIVIIFAKRRHRYSGPRMPKSIGSLIPWVAYSRMLRDFEGLHYMSSKERDKVLGQLDRRYGFGRFRGEDGRVRLGIEFDEMLLERGAFGDR